MTDKDLQQKKRLMRFLWTNGYLVRRNIDLVRYDFGKRTDESFTDLDVIGIRFQFDFQIEKAIAYCTTSKIVKSKKLMFWLEGLREYFGADKSYLVRSEIFESRYMDAAMKLGILPLSEDHLNSLEDTYFIDKNLFIGPFNGNCFKKEGEAFTNLKQAEKRIYNYLKVDYWVDKPYKKIISLLHSMKMIGDNTGINKKNSFFLKMNCLSLLSLAILEFSRPILFIKKAEREHQVRERILGGDMSFDKCRQIEGFYDFMSAEIFKKYGRKYDVSRKGFLQQFYPSYTKHLMDIIERICNKPKMAIYIPNLIDLISYELGLNDNNINRDLLKTYYEGEQFDILKKLTKDMLIFAQRSESISEEDTNKAAKSMVF